MQRITPPNRRPEQLKMFMTAHEITSKYQVLDGDRHNYDSWGGYGSNGSTYSASDRGINVGGYRMESDDAVWDRKYQEAQQDPEDYRADVNDLNKPYKRPNGESTNSPGTWRDVSQGDDTYEAEGTRQTFKPFEERFTQSLRDHIVDGGEIPPVHLSNQFGSQGKPMVFGGHHRIAVLKNEAPDKLIPVIHHDNWGKARGSEDKDYKYT